MASESACILRAAVRCPVAPRSLATGGAGHRAPAHEPSRSLSHEAYRQAGFPTRPVRRTALDQWEVPGAPPQVSAVGERDSQDDSAPVIASNRQRSMVGVIQAGQTHPGPAESGQRMRVTAARSAGWLTRVSSPADLSCPSWARTRTLLIQRGRYNRLDWVPAHLPLLDDKVGVDRPPVPCLVRHSNRVLVVPRRTHIARAKERRFRNKKGEVAVSFHVKDGIRLGSSSGGTAEFANAESNTLPLRVLTPVIVMGKRVFGMTGPRRSRERIPSCRDRARSSRRNKWRWCRRTLKR